MAQIFNLGDLKAKQQKTTQKKIIPKKTNEPNGKTLSILKVTLANWDGTIKGNAYRVLSIPTEKTLDKLAEAILDSFDFDMDHMYGFYDNIKMWSRSTESYTMDDESENPTRLVTDTLIGEVFQKPKKKLLFLFDYGDEWKFVVELVKEIEADGKTKLSTQVIESKGDAPPQYPDFEA